MSQRLHLRPRSTRLSRYRRGWPTSLKHIRHALLVLLQIHLFDCLLLACLVAFSAFALMVNYYDRASTFQNLWATRLLLEATNCVICMLLEATNYVITRFYLQLIGRAGYMLGSYYISNSLRIRGQTSNAYRIAMAD